MTHQATQVLIFVEDPGAANYLADVPAALAESQWRVSLLATAHGADVLKGRGVGFEPWNAQEDAASVLVRFAPRLLMVGTSENQNTVGLELIDAARAKRIISVGVVDAVTNSAHRFRGRGQPPLTHAPDWMIVPDAATEKAFTKLGYPPSRIVSCGHASLETVRHFQVQHRGMDRATVRKRFLPRDPGGRRVVVFVAEISSGFAPEQFQRTSDYTLLGRGSSVGRTEIVIEELLDAVAELPRRPFLVLRLHPKNSLEEFERYGSEFDCLSRGGSPLGLVYAADLVVGMTSILLAEADWLGRPVLSIVPRIKEKHWLPAVAQGRIPVAATCHDTRRWVAELLCRPSCELPQPREKVPASDSCERICDAVRRFLSVGCSCG